MSRWTRWLPSVLVAGLLIACFFGVLAFLVLGFSPDPQRLLGTSSFR